MRNSTVRFVLALLMLVLGAAGEEMLPKVLGVGVPLLLSSVIILARRDPVSLPILFALTAGFMEDSLSSLPLFATPAWFLLVVIILRISRLSMMGAVAVFPLYQIWLCLWTLDFEGGVFTRILFAIPVGALTIWLLVLVIRLVERKVAADEAD